MLRAVFRCRRSGATNTRQIPNFCRKSLAQYLENSHFAEPESGDWFDLKLRADLAVKVQLKLSAFGGIADIDLLQCECLVLTQSGRERHYLFFVFRSRRD